MENRRSFLQKSGLVLAQIPLMNIAAMAGSKPQATSNPVCIYSKHLHWLDFREMGIYARDLGFDGIDLTVRKGGHVAPELAESLLPKAIEEITSSGIIVPMMVTDINSADDALTEKIVKTAAASGIKFYRFAYYRYTQEGSIPSQLDDFRRKIEKLAELNAKYNIHGAYQNHAGDYVGASVWDIWYLINGLDSRYIGVQFDPRHAVVEGGESWQVDMRLVKDYIHCSIMKDFLWEKEDKWMVKNTPLGEGMVDFSQYFNLYKQFNLSGPISLHVEYPIFPEPEEKYSKEEKNKIAERVFTPELAFIRDQLKKAGI
ncbi:MAG: sugar phosphate isomerase/epimerase family protein [Cyclobacteriaceae bacterium]|nr:sugar phosphate isomerase/epimerase family protein [Cyclobacteriaceae bacterium]